MKQVLCAKCKVRPAVFFVTRVENEKSTQVGFCMKCAMEMNIGPVKQIMQSMGISEEEFEEMSTQFNSFLENADGSGFEPGGAGTLPLFESLGQMNLDGFKSEPISAEDMPDDQDDGQATRKDERLPGGKKRGKKKDAEQGKRKFLPMYCTDLTAKAKDGQIDRIIGRENEIYRTVQILCRRSKNNPCLIGEPGVGKTAIAEGLALRIAGGHVPAKLANKEIHLLDLTALVAGTQFRGQFESRIKGLVDEVKAEKNIILFIDEVHNLVGAGDAEGSMNAANILKPSLSRGEIQIIGATTFNEYRKHIEKDAALERRLQPVKIEEPSVEDTYQMLLGIKDYYENYHRVAISDSLIYQSVVLSERYINDRFLPDKAIDLLDESCTCANLRNKHISEWEMAENKLLELQALHLQLVENVEDEEVDFQGIAKLKSEISALEDTMPNLEELASDNAVTEEDLATVIQLWTGIPVQRVIESDLRRLSDLEKKLKEKIIGQDNAVALVAAAIRRGRVQINPRRRPSSFIFVGPTGVGKTELVKQLANELFDTPETLIRLDMSEFMEKHSVSRIIGSPPGYVGYDEAGQLTEKVRRKPYSVLLFDEIEKAHPDVMNILLQILDEGKISDAQGRTVSFENTVIIMTSNAGSDKKEGALGFTKSKSDASKEKVMKALSDFLRPEFIGRVDEIAVFNELSAEDYERIAVLMLDELVEPLRDKGIIFSWEAGVPAVLAGSSVGGIRGARDLSNVIRRSVEDKIASLIVDSLGRSIKTVTVVVKNDEVAVIST
ncbi:MAG: ATP-dependent Clp protease ATP-binding subunit [Clostridiales bacterium]|nr:ATP-dependent Clp protease ATP-binding subunit [Clostridiales bacterium]